MSARFWLGNHNLFKVYALTLNLGLKTIPQPDICNPQCPWGDLQPPSWIWPPTQLWCYGESGQCLSQLYLTDSNVWDYKWRIWRPDIGAGELYNFFDNHFWLFPKEWQEAKFCCSIHIRPSTIATIQGLASVQQPHIVTWTEPNTIFILCWMHSGMWMLSESLPCFSLLEHSFVVSIAAVRVTSDNHYSIQPSCHHASILIPSAKHQDADNFFPISKSLLTLYFS